MEAGLSCIFYLQGSLNNRMGDQKFAIGKAQGQRPNTLVIRWTHSEEFIIPKTYGSYEVFLADPEIEAIYNPLPNHLHVPPTLMAASAGKHVLCEKPIAITAQEAGQLKEASSKVFIAEAFMVRHYPQWQHARNLIQKELSER
jgi:predicted dehydrogenase